MKTSVKLPKGYQNNPFYAATDGLDLLFKKAQSVGIMLAIFSGILLLGSLPGNFGSTNLEENSSAPAQSTTAGNPFENIPTELIVGFVIAATIFFLVMMLVGIVINGASDYTSAQLAKGKTATLGEALRAIFGHFWSYTWMSVILGVKIILWSLLFIIPGIVMAYRYSLAGVSFFDKNLRGNAAVKHSASTTKGAWLTTFASQNLLNLITFGLISPLLTPGTKAVLYRQLVKLNGDKPKAHFLSWLTLLLPLLLTLAIIMVVLALIYAFANFAGSQG